MSNTTNSNLTKVAFNYYSLTFHPYKEGETEFNDNKILREIVNFIRSKRSEKSAVVVDKNYNQDNKAPRNLFIYNASFLPRKSRILASIALIREGRLPMIKKPNEMEIVPLTAVETGASVVELTHFFIDYSGHQPVVCVEYNHNGPRWSDIEYYIRHICRDHLRIAKHVISSLYMKAKIEDTLNALVNVLKLDVKVKPNNLVQLDPDVRSSYFTGLDKLQDTLDTKYLRFEASYYSPGSNLKIPVNNKANSMVTTLLKKFISRSHNIDAFEDFQVKYEDKNGHEQIFNLLKGKVESEVEMDIKKTKTNTQWHDSIQDEFDNFMKSRYATSR